MVKHHVTLVLTVSLSLSRLFAGKFLLLICLFFLGLLLFLLLGLFFILLAAFFSHDMSPLWVWYLPGEAGGEQRGAALDTCIILLGGGNARRQVFKNMRFG